MVKNWNSFMLQLQELQDNETKRLLTLRCQTTAATQLAAMTALPTMDPGWIWAFNPDAPGSLGAKDDVLWFEFKADDQFLSCLGMSMTTSRAAKFLATPWHFDFKKFARPFNVDTDTKGELIETKYFPGFKVDRRSSNEQRRKLLKRIIDLTRRFLDKNGHSDRLVAYLYIVASFNSDIHSSYNLWPIDKDAPLRLRGGDALATALDDYLIAQSKNAEKVVSDAASKEKTLPPVQTMPPPAAPASKDKLKSSKATSDEEVETKKEVETKRVANVPSGSKTTNDDIKRSVKDLFPRLTAHMDDIEKTTLGKIKENYMRTKNNHDDHMRLENLLQETGNVVTQLKKDLAGVSSFVRVVVASQLNIEGKLPFASDAQIVDFFSRQKGESKEDLVGRKLGLENYMRVKDEVNNLKFPLHALRAAFTEEYLVGHYWPTKGEKFSHLSGWDTSVDKIINEEVMGQIVPWQLFEWFDQFTATYVLPAFIARGELWVPTSWRKQCAKVFGAARDRLTLKHRLQSRAQGDEPAAEKKGKTLKVFSSTAAGKGRKSKLKKGSVEFLDSACGGGEESSNARKRKSKKAAPEKIVRLDSSEDEEEDEIISSDEEDLDPLSSSDDSGDKKKKTLVVKLPPAKKMATPGAKVVSDLAPLLLEREDPEASTSTGRKKRKRTTSANSATSASSRSSSRSSSRASRKETVEKTPQPTVAATSNGMKQAAVTTQGSEEVDPMDWEDSGAPDTPSRQDKEMNQAEKDGCTAGQQNLSDLSLTSLADAADAAKDTLQMSSPAMAALASASSKDKEEEEEDKGEEDDEEEEEVGKP